MIVEADVSDFAMREVLLMKCEDERWRPVISGVQYEVHV